MYTCAIVHIQVMYLSGDPRLGLSRAIFCSTAPDAGLCPLRVHTLVWGLVQTCPSLRVLTVPAISCCSLPAGLAQLAASSAVALCGELSNTEGG